MDEPMEDQGGVNQSNEQHQQQSIDTERKKLPSLLRPVVMGAITKEEYSTQYWPKLENAIIQLLTQTPGDYIPISYEQMYSCVYKCVCQQHSEQMYNDLIKVVTQHLERLSTELQASSIDVYVERFNFALTQYTQALGGIVPIFNYMNRFYVATKLNTDLKDELSHLYTVYVADKHVTGLFTLLEEAQHKPFTVSPPTMANIIKGLHHLKPAYAQLKPYLFAKFIPNILPPAQEDLLEQYVEETRQMQQELIERQGYSRDNQGRKRPGEDSMQKSVSSSYMPKNSSS
ncbi:CDK2-associated and cullin domain-containing protein 1-like [Saccoglossus kowalevskii]|uniref:CDK2-associated and cullin domain-containing protein 1-like n=1 Tax=Saccoglossus kowalevskii TaxID=10224 RepID=A0ABM0M7N5_SACKO|nr:PREDICTED: CDK2-associated and cullin domain-containing protein 1-like [Saccoglossus kowalevskii]